MEEFAYIVYPVRAEKIRELGLAPKEEQKDAVPKYNEEGFMPLWYGMAAFPEDDVD